jgi:Beta-lactamase
MQAKFAKYLLVGAVLTSGFSVAYGEETEATIRAYAAGYKAAFTCSALFNGHKTLAQIKAHELTGIYPLVQDIVNTLPDAVIDHDNKTVSVKYSDTMPPRISAHRGLIGCTDLPVGATAADIAHLPELHRVYRSRRDASYPWKTLNPKAGAEKLTALLSGAFTNKAYGKQALTTALLVATPETLLAENYIDGFDIHTSQRTWSVAKSIAATLVGAAVEQGTLDTAAPAPIAEWQSPIDPRKAITLDNLLRMASGLDSNRAGNRTDRVYLGGGRMSDTATEAALEAIPGTRWKYANNDTMLAVRALRSTFKNTANSLASPEALFHRLGMNDTRAETDWEGNFIMSSQVWTTSRDLARLGILYLQNGMWEGERILPESWVKYVSAPAGPQPPAKRTNGSAIAGYGAQFWLFNERFPNIPNDTFAAMGNRGQYLVIIPSKNIVIVRRGYDPAGGEGFKIDKFIEDVLKALD